MDAHKIHNFIVSVHPRERWVKSARTDIFNYDATNGGLAATPEEPGS